MGQERLLALPLLLLVSNPPYTQGADFRSPPQVRDFAIEGWILQERVSKEDIERQFNIKLYTLREDYSKQGREYPEANPDFAAIPQNWEEEQLGVLKKLLDSLPPHLHQSFPDGKQLEIILSYSNHCRDTDSPDAIPYQIELSHKYLRSETQRDGLALWRIF